MTVAVAVIGTARIACIRRLAFFFGLLCHVPALGHLCMRCVVGASPLGTAAPTHLPRRFLARLKLHFRLGRELAALDLFAHMREVFGGLSLRTVGRISLGQHRVMVSLRKECHIALVVREGLG